VTPPVPGIRRSIRITSGRNSSARLTARAVGEYLLSHHTPADDVLGELAVATREATAGAAGMQISSDEGTLLTMPTRLTGARFAVEVGVFTGYSTLCIARGLADGGRLLACDISEEWTAIGRPYWERAGVADRIDLRIAPRAGDAARARHRAGRRPRVHRRRQGRLPGVLRGDRAPTAARRAGGAGQRLPRRPRP